MLEFTVWRDLCVAFVRIQALALGWTVHQVKQSATSRSTYVDLRRGAARAQVRLSDHRPSKCVACRSRLFSVRQPVTIRLADLQGFLVNRLPS